MKLIIDAQLPVALGRAFADAGLLAIHVRTIGLLSASDAEIWAFARREGCAIITKDEDFAALWMRGDRAVPIVWVRTGNCSTTALLARLAPQISHIASMLEAGETMIEIR